MKTLTNKDSLRASIAFIYEQFLQKEDKFNAEKLLDLSEKLNANDWTVSFSGHFSAGKSTMINQLLDQKLLPQSPIPTSANIVRITSGEPGIAVFNNNGTKKSYPLHTDLRTIQNLCKDGESIRRIDITKEQGTIPDGVTIMDTPGIDSANDADRVITESSLHLVDLLVYVMDYNHVQSEVNLNFLKEMQKRNKPVYVVINQIDKHVEEEIEFEAFKASVQAIFRNWSLNPEKVFFTSLSEENVIHNQWKAFRMEIDQQIQQKETKLLHTVTESVNTILHSHMKKQKAHSDDYSTASSEKKIKYLHAELQSLKETADKELKEFKVLEKDYRTLVESTSRNAMLIPFEVREKAEDFLEASKADFKPGIFATKKKAENIRLERKETFFAALQEKITTNLDWKLREKIIEFIKNNPRIDNVYLEEVQNVSSSYHADRLEALIKPGAGITSEYLLRYTEEVSNDIKSSYKQAYLKIWEKIKQPLEVREKEIEKELEEKSQKIKEQIDQAAQTLEIQQQLEEYERSLYNGFQSPPSTSVLLKLIDRKIKERSYQVLEESADMADEKKQDQNVVPLVKENTKHDHSEFKAEESHQKLQQAEEIFNGLKGFESLTSVLQEKRERLQNQHFSVALFGAFSAGKSSFANALLGEYVLPVSPNPTTAVINKISPVDSSHGHGTVITKVKNEDSILADLEELETEIPGNNLREKISAIQHVLENEGVFVPIREQAFLQAIIEGYPNLSDKLGEQVIIDRQQFAEYVATESIACYLEWTELYFDCPLTRQGISLIDTPGADSINSRHTELSFEYIKDADAVLFVTYYNHAFSKADKDFLLQLGRVKDAFSLDKMFFIINACDLAADQEELNLVEDYVTDQLIKFGIRKPRMFPLSSKEGLKEKSEELTNKNSGLPEFEETFYHFLHHELAELLTKSALHDIERGFHQLESFINTASLETKEKEKRAEKLDIQQKKLLNEISSDKSTGFQEEINQKLEKQLFYVHERDKIQYNDRFKEFFNPTTITTSGSALKQEAEDNIHSLKKETAYQLSQEVRAVTLRMEKFLNQKAGEYIEVLEAAAKKYEPGISFSYWDDKKINTPEVKTGLSHIKTKDFDKSLSLFKTKKVILDRSEREVVKDSIYEELRVPIEEYLKDWKVRLALNYENEWQQIQLQIKNKCNKTIKEYYEGVFYSLSEQLDIPELMKKLEQIKKIID